MRAYSKTLVLSTFFFILLLLYFFARRDALLKAEQNGGSLRDVRSAVTFHPPLLRDTQQETRRRQKLTKILSGSKKITRKHPKQFSMSISHKGPMHLALVACRNHLEEALTMMKSALLFSNRKIMFHIFTEESIKLMFETRLKQWLDPLSSKFQYIIREITFSIKDAEEWKKIFQPCAAQHLFLPVVLKDVDSLLYVDTDVLFLRPVEDIWSFLNMFNDTQLAGMTLEHEIPNRIFDHHSIKGIAGINSGVMLMNLTRIRSAVFKNSLIPNGVEWKDLLNHFYEKYKNYITWKDQDMLNIIFHDNPEYLYKLPCQWNYRPQHCMYGSNCKGAEEEGVSILHGNNGVYYDDKQPAFKAVYEAIHGYTIEENMFQSLLYPLQTKFLDTVNTLCGRIPQIFLKQIEKTLKKVYEQRVVIHLGHLQY